MGIQSSGLMAEPWVAAAVCGECFSTSTNIRSTLSIACGEYAMMRRNVDTTRTARACQIASLLLVLMMVLGVLVQDIMLNADTAEAVPAGGSKPARLVVVP
jgi:hypothetical protein